MFFNKPYAVQITTHMRQAMIGAGLFAALAGAAHSDSVGTIVQALGDASLGSTPATAGTTVQTGVFLTTGANGYIYIKTVDGGFLILRPGSRAQVVAYQVDVAQPANSRFKIELIQGVARNISGEAVKKSRENFRFNTPVAAIGVRGTDFTVFTDAQTTRVSVTAGGVVVSGFSAGCGPEGSGPCEGSAVRELFASQAGQVLQVNRGQVLPQMLRGNFLLPDVTTPPHPDEPPKSAPAGINATLGADPNLAPLKLAGLDSQAPTTPTAPTTPPAPSEPSTAPAPSEPSTALTPPNLPTTTVAAPQVALPAVPAITWGRWQPFADQAANLSLGPLMRDNKQVAINSFFALGRRQTSLWQAPVAASVGFSLQNSQALIQSDATGTVSAAALENGKLTVDFVKNSFTTQFDLLALGQRKPLHAIGAVGSSGAFGNAGQYSTGNNMQVQGVLANDATGISAAYLFQSRIDDAHTVSGITTWSK